MANSPRELVEIITTLQTLQSRIPGVKAELASLEESIKKAFSGGVDNVAAFKQINSDIKIAQNAAKEYFASIGAGTKQSKAAMAELRSEFAQIKELSKTSPGGIRSLIKPGTGADAAAFDKETNSIIKSLKAQADKIVKAEEENTRRILEARKQSEDAATAARNTPEYQKLAGNEASFNQETQDIIAKQRAEAIKIADAKTKARIDAERSAKSSNESQYAQLTAKDNAYNQETQSIIDAQKVKAAQIVDARVAARAPAEQAAKIANEQQYLQLTQERLAFDKETVDVIAKQKVLAEQLVAERVKERNAAEQVAKAANEKQYQDLTAKDTAYNKETQDIIAEQKAKAAAIVDARVAERAPIEAEAKAANEVQYKKLTEERLAFDKETNAILAEQQAIAERIVAARVKAVGATKQVATAEQQAKANWEGAESGARQKWTGNSAYRDWDSLSTDEKRAAMRGMGFRDNNTPTTPQGSSPYSDEGYARLRANQAQLDAQAQAQAQAQSQTTPPITIPIPPQVAPPGPQILGAYEKATLVIEKYRKVLGGDTFAKGTLKTKLKDNLSKDELKDLGDFDELFANLKNTGLINQVSANRYEFKGNAQVKEVLDLNRAYSEGKITVDEYKKSLDALNNRKTPTGQQLPLNTQPVSQPSKAELEQMQRTEALTTGGGLRQLFGSDEQFNNFQKRLGELKIGINQVKSATTDLASGVTTVNFEAFDEATGLAKTATVHIDQFGRTVNDTSNRFKSFGEIIANNVTKVLTWALALGLVYGSMQKFTELAQRMQQIQVEMANIGIVTGQTGQALNKLFDSAFAAAQAVSGDLTTGLASLDSSLRATASISDDQERVRVSTLLLTDAMKLSKLAGIDTAKALDQLLASLKQLDMPLTSGSQLLDKFQSVANAANTSMEDMAATFSITAGAAQDVGVTTDQLVGLIGAFSEATSLSATETGNALRAMFSNFTQPKAIETLNKYGIAVKDVNGDFLSFIEVFNRASELARSGILNDRQVAEIANALGGGSRRQAQVKSLLTVAPRGSELAEVSKNESAGAAESALAVQTKTLDSAVVRLNNSFSNIAETLGTKGGFLDAMTSGVNLLTSLLDIINKVVGALGPLTPALLGLGALSAIKTSYGPEISKFIGKAGGAMVSPFANIEQAFDNRQLNKGIGLANRIATARDPEQLPFINTSEKFAKGFGQAMLPVFVIGAGKFVESVKTGDWMDTAGTFVGGGIAAALSGNPVWALVGSTIGSFIANEVTRLKDLFEKYNDAKGSPYPELPKGASPDQISKVISDTQTQMSELSAEDSIGRRANRARTVGMTDTEVLQRTAEAYGNLLSQGLSSDQALGQMEQGFTLKTSKNFLGQDVTKEGYGTMGFEKETVIKFYEGLEKLKMYSDAFTKSLDGTNVLPEYVQSSIPENDRLYNALLKDNEPQNQAYNKSKRYSLIEDFSENKINRSTYKDRSEALSSTGLTSSLVLSALKPDIPLDQVSKYRDEWAKLNDTILMADQESRVYLSESAVNLRSYGESIASVQQEIDKMDMDKISGKQIDTAKYADLQTQLLGLKDKAAITTQEIYGLLKSIEAVNQAEFKFKGFSDASDLTKKQFEQVIANARDLQASYSKQVKGQNLDDLIMASPELIFKEKEGFTTVNGVQDAFIQDSLRAFQQYQKDLQSTFNFQNLRNVDVSQKGRLQQAMNYYLNLLKQYGLNDKMEKFTVLFKDNQVGQLVGSQTALQLAIQDLTEVTKKQLDGVYNLPSGATAYIPLSAGQMLSNYSANQASGSNIDYGNFPTPVLQEGNLYASRTAQGVERLVDLMGKPLDPKQQLDDAKKGLETGKYENFVKALYDLSIFNNEMGPPDPNQKSLSGPNAGPTPSNVYKHYFGASPTSGGDLFSVIGGMLKSSLGAVTNLTTQGSSQNIKITPGKIENSVSTNITLRINSKVLWNEIKKDAYEDYVRFSSSVGSNSRTQSNVI